MKAINIVLFGHGPKSPDMSFIEIEDDEGNSIRVGEWSRFKDGSNYWTVRITPEDILNAIT
jgi:hypothetical protein